MVGSTAVGFVLGSVVADVVSYVMAIFSYELFQRLLVVRKPRVVGTEPVAALAAA